MKKKNICKQVDYNFLVSVLSQTSDYVGLHNKLKTYIQKNKSSKPILRKRAN